MASTEPVETPEDWSAIYNCAVAQLARREHARMELRAKLLRKFPAAQIQIEQVLDRLTEQNYLNDARFCDAYVRHRSGRGFGRERIARELAERGVDDAVVHNILDESDNSAEIDWLLSIEQTWQKKFKHPPHDYPERARQMRFLLYRGFTQQQIQQLFQRLKDRAF